MGDVPGEGVAVEDLPFVLVIAGVGAGSAFEGGGSLREVSPASGIFVSMTFQEVPKYWRMVSSEFASGVRARRRVRTLGFGSMGGSWRLGGLLGGF